MHHRFLKCLFFLGWVLTPPMATAENWLMLNANAEATDYFDTTSVKRISDSLPYISYAIKTQYHQPQNITHHKTYTTTIAEIKIDCMGNRFALVKADYYDEHQQLIDSDQLTKDNWQKMTADSMMNSMLRAGCYMVGYRNEL